MAKKKNRQYTIVAFIVLIIGIGILLPHTGDNGEFTSIELTSIDNISKQESFNNVLAKRLISAIKCYKNVDDVTLNAETSPLQVNIITKNSNSITSEAKERIEKLIVGAYPNSPIEIEYSYSDETNK